MKNWLRTASSRLLRGAAHSFAHLLPLVIVVEILVNPPNRLVLAPEGFQLGVVEELEEFLELRLAREEQAEGREAVEEDAEVEGEFVEEAAEEDAVALVLAAEVGAGDVLEDLEAFRVEAVADALEHQLALLGHAERGEAVQDGERLLAEHALDGILERRLAAGEAALKMGDALAQECAGGALVVIEAGELVEVEDATSWA